MNRREVLVIVAGLVAVLVAVVLAAAITARESEQPPAEPAELGWYDVPAGDEPDPTALCLVARGWTGDPGDSRERVYAPPSVIAWCSQRPPGELLDVVARVPVEVAP